jgi:hypothetical protein
MPFYSVRCRPTPNPLRLARLAPRRRMSSSAQTPTPKSPPPPASPQSFYQRWTAARPEPARFSSAWWLVWTIRFIVFGITGSSSVYFVRPFMRDYLGLEGEPLAAARPPVSSTSPQITRRQPDLRTVAVPAGLGADCDTHLHGHSGLRGDLGWPAGVFHDGGAPHVGPHHPRPARQEALGLGTRMHSRQPCSESFPCID